MEISALDTNEYADSIFVWRKRLDIPNALSMAAYTGSKHASADSKRTGESSQVAMLLSELLAPLVTTIDLNFDEIVLRRDENGKPFLHWTGLNIHYAESKGIRPECVHLSNSNDGGISLFFAAYDERLLGVGIDIVALSRLRAEHKNRAYLLRFVHHFMSGKELQMFEENAASESIDFLVIRAAAHFSLMESISKALGTGLKIGAGLGKPISLPKQSVGISRLTPEVAIIMETPALERMVLMGADRVEAHWGADENYLVSAALLWK